VATGRQVHYPFSCYQVVAHELSTLGQVLHRIMHVPCGFISSFAPTSALAAARFAPAPAVSSAGRPTRLRMTAATPSKRELRRAIVNSENFNRLGFPDTKAEAAGMMTSEFTSALVDELLKTAYTVKRGGVTVKLAKAYGFCWGVERAVAMAYETRKQYPNHRIHITNEIIHNPIVNQRLREMDVFFVPQDGMVKDLSSVREGDVVILPAFGATLEEMQTLNDRGCQIVDTTCPWVSKVWGALDKHKRANCTSLIHGKWAHEETVATASFADKYIVVLNMSEAEYVADYILNGGNRDEFLAKFKNAMSADFDPDSDLEAVGVANQTTMLKSETAAIGKLFERTMMRKFGTADLKQHFVAYDTICDATQERQDAMVELLQDKSVDMMIVVGGFNSSNTSHLQEMAEHAGIISYWVDRPDCVGPGNSIVSRSSNGIEQVFKDWLPSKDLVIGVTSGASTPDKVVEDVMENIFMIHKLSQVAP
jgi:4-hydroxy-3-methylbut-2-en-1-yl diphosphate reductase